MMMSARRDHTPLGEDGWTDCARGLEKFVPVKLCEFGTRSVIRIGVKYGYVLVRTEYVVTC